MKLNRTPNPLDRNARNGENDNWDIIEGETRRLNDKVDNFLNTLSEDAFNKVVDDIRLNWSHKVDNFTDLPTNPKKGDTVAVENDDMIYRYDGSNWIAIIPFTQFSAIAEIDNRLSSQLADNEKEQFKGSLINHKNNKRKLVVWEDDDGMAGIYTKLYPILKEYNIKMTAAIITGRGHGFPINGLPAHNPTYISYEQMKEMEDDGVIEFVSHTHSHRYFDSLTLEEVDEECRTSQEIIKELGWNYRDIVYPGGRRDKDIIDVVRQYYDSATIVGGNPFTAPFDMYQVPRIGTPNSGFNVEERKQIITQALDEHGFAILLTHVDLNDGLDIPAFKQLIEHCLAEGAEFVTRRELMREYGNLLQVDGATISSDGEVHGSKIGVYRRYDSRQVNAPVSLFKKGTVTRFKVFQDDAADYGIPNGANPTYGFMEVHRDLSSDTFSNMLFYDIRNNRIFNRRWSNSANNWLAWAEVGGNYYDYAEAFTPNTHVNEFPKGEVIKLRVPQGKSSEYGIPDFGNEPIYGFVEVHRDSNQDVFSTQVFYDGRNSYMLSRRWSDTTQRWTAWLPLGGYYIDIGRSTGKNQPITAFKKGIVSKFKVLQDDAADYGIPTTDSPSWGYIEVHRDLESDLYSCQIFYDIRNKRQLMRRWTQGAWDSWE